MLTRVVSSPEELPLGEVKGARDCHRKNAGCFRDLRDLRHLGKSTVAGNRHNYRKVWEEGGPCQEMLYLGPDGIIQVPEPSWK